MSLYCLLISIGFTVGLIIIAAICFIAVDKDPKGQRRLK